MRGNIGVDVGVNEARNMRVVFPGDNSPSAPCGSLVSGMNGGKLQGCQHNNWCNTSIYICVYISSALIEYYLSLCGMIM